MNAFTSVDMGERYSDAVRKGWTIKGISESTDSEDHILDGGNRRVN